MRKTTLKMISRQISRKTRALNLLQNAFANFSWICVFINRPANNDKVAALLLCTNQICNPLLIARTLAKRPNTRAKRDKILICYIFYELAFKDRADHAIKPRFKAHLAKFPNRARNSIVINRFKFALAKASKC